MTGKRIGQLCEFIPSGSSYLGYLPNLGKIPNISQDSVDAMNRWAKSITNPRFGWEFVHALVERGAPLPRSISENYLIRAYYARVSNSRDVAVDRALTFERERCFEPQRTIAKTMVFAQRPITEIAATLGGGFDADMLLAWEELLFNVRDRMSDVGYLHGLLYPNGPVVENDANYLRLEALHMVTMRLAFHYGWEHAALTLGIRPRGELDPIDTVVAAQTVEREIMAAALRAVRTGGLNQPGNVAIGHARQIITAVKAAGGEDNVGEERYGLSIIGSENAAVTELQRMTLSLDERIMQLQNDLTGDTPGKKRPKIIPMPAIAGRN